MIWIFLFAAVLAFPACVVLAKLRARREAFAHALEARRAERDSRQRVEVWIEVRTRG